MIRQVFMLAAALMLGVGLWTAPPAPVAADEGCYEAEFTYTNTSVPLYPLATQHSPVAPVASCRHTVAMLPLTSRKSRSCHLRVAR